MPAPFVDNKLTSIFQHDGEVSYLAGGWRFERTITSFPVMIGQALFSSYDTDPEALFYREDLKFPAPSGELLTGSREYVYRVHDGQLTIYFSNGGKQGDLFMQLNSNDRNGGALTGRHLCKADLYQGELIIIDRDRFLIRYTVTGPKKNHVLETLYSRVRGHEEVVDRRRDSA